MTREELDLGPDVTQDDELATEVALHELEASRQLAAELPVLATIQALQRNASPSTVLTATQVRRELASAFGRDVTLIHNGKIRSREEDH